MNVLPDFIEEWLFFCKKKNKPLSYAMSAWFSRDFLLERFGDDDNRVRWLSNPKNQELFAQEWLKNL